MMAPLTSTVGLAVKLASDEEGIGMGTRLGQIEGLSEVEEVLATVVSEGIAGKVTRIDKVERLFEDDDFVAMIISNEGSTTLAGPG